MNAGLNDPIREHQVREQIEKLKSAGAYVIGGYRAGSEFVAKIQREIDAGRTVVYAPKLKVMRHFYNTQGFQIGMSQVAAELRNFTVTIPADRYGKMHVFAVSPLKERGATAASSG